MSLIDSVRDILIEAGLPAGPLPLTEAVLAGVPGYPPDFERMVAVAQLGRHAPLLVVYIATRAFDLPAIRVSGYAMLADRIAVLGNPELAASVEPGRLQELVALSNLANRLGGTNGALTWSTAATSVAISAVMPFPAGVADATSIEFLTRTALSVDGWVPDVVAILGGQETAVDRIVLRMPSVVPDLTERDGLPSVDDEWDGPEIDTGTPFVADL